MADELDRAASELRVWFSSLLGLCDRTVFAVSTQEAHRQAAMLGVLTRNAKTLIHGALDSGGDLYTPLCFVLAAACRRLGLEPGDREWRSAIKNVLRLKHELGSVRDQAALPVGSAAAIFKEQLDEALVNAGVTDRPTILDRHNRDLALGLAVNWGLRFLVAYALELSVAAPEAEHDVRDLGWVRQAVRRVQHAA